MFNLFTGIACVGVCVLFMASVFWLVRKFGHNLDLPTGRTGKATFFVRGKRALETVFVLTDREASGLYSCDALAMQCCYINHAVRTILKEHNLLPSTAAKHQRIVVHAMADPIFNAMMMSHLERARGRQYVEETNAYICRCETRFFGKNWTMVCIRSRLLHELMLNGEPLVHGLLHAYQENFSIIAPHLSPHIWKAAGGEQSAQAKIRKLVLTT